MSAPAATVAGMNTHTPQVPIGFLSKLGTVAAAVAVIAAGIAALANGDHTPETVTGIVTAGGIIYGVIRERGRQAAKAIEVAPRLAEAETYANDRERDFQRLVEERDELARELKVRALDREGPSA